MLFICRVYVEIASTSVQRGFMQLLHPTTPRNLEAILPILKQYLFLSFSMLGAKAHLEAPRCLGATIFFLLAATRQIVDSNEEWNLVVNGSTCAFAKLRYCRSVDLSPTSNFFKISIGMGNFMTFSYICRGIRIGLKRPFVQPLHAQLSMRSSLKNRIMQFVLCA